MERRGQMNGFTHNRTPGVILITVSIVLILAMLFPLTGCNNNSTTATTSVATTQTSTSSSTPATTQTIKVGTVFNQGVDIGLDAQHTIEVMVDADNKNGGIDIGGQKYKVELVTYNNNGSQEGETSAINRLVFQDKVKFILGVGQFESGWLPITESNKVIVMTTDPNANVDLAANTHYSFNPTFEDLEIPAKVGWYIKTYPDKAKNMVIVFQNNQFGHMISGLILAEFKAFGATPQIQFFPESMQDLSSVATKVISLNPSSVMVLTADTASDALGFAAIYQAGYRGPFFTATNNPVDTWLKLTTPDVLEGFIMGMYPTEPEPALTPAAQEFKQLWTAKYGSWTNPTTLSTSLYSCLKTALEKAGSLDTDKVSDTIASGMEFTSPIGNGKMVSRPDLGNNRTVDSVTSYYVKTIKSGKAELLTTITADDAVGYMRTAFPPLPPGATPGGPPPDAGAPPSGSPPAGAPPSGAPPAGAP